MFELQTDRTDLVRLKLEMQFPGEIVHAEMQYDMLCITVRKDKVHDILLYLSNDKDLDFNFLTTLCGMHYPSAELELGLVYHLHSFASNRRIRLKTATRADDPHFPTATDIWAAANWMERETWDFFGIVFDGHPNLKRILNVDDFEGFPLRKDFRLEDQTREDKNDSMFGR